MPNYRRNFLPGGTFFFTVNLLERDRDLLVRHVDALRNAVRTVRAAHPFEIVAWVVMPDHLHCIWILPPGDTNYPERWRLIKLLFSRSLPKTEHINASRESKNERGIWQRRFWEHTIRDERDLNNHIDYVHYNPVKHGYVTNAADWPHSTIHRYIEQGRNA
ncbi:transposase [Uliginosibacterium flavum]|uniref:Transposase n=1 Tax=Uliginosibacterium flavum TaxID=1396831 RepID=A0ABV2TLS4_9RHOO